MRLRRAAATALVVAAAVVAAAAPAAAAADAGALQVSADGVAYASSNTLPVFPDALRLVPGDTRTASVWVRNVGQEAGRLRIELYVPQDPGGLQAAGVEVSAAPDGEAAQAVSAASAERDGGCAVLSGGRVLAAGESARVDVSVVMPASLTGTEAAQQSLRFSLGASLYDAQVQAPLASGSACLVLPAVQRSAASGVPLAHTGGEFPLAAAVVGGVGLATGILFFVFARRREMADDGSRDL